MTKEELKKFKKPLPWQFEKIGVQFVHQYKSDKYGVYSTGFYEYKGKQIFINVEDGLWHLSVAANHPLGYYEIKEIRYKFMPNDMQVGQIFPPREEFVNIHENCYHLFELNSSEISNSSIDEKSK